MTTGARVLSDEPKWMCIYCGGPLVAGEVHVQCNWYHFCPRGHTYQRHERHKHIACYKQTMEADLDD